MVSGDCVWNGVAPRLRPQVAVPSAFRHPCVVVNVVVHQISY